MPRRSLTLTAGLVVVVALVVGVVLGLSGTTRLSRPAAAVRPAGSASGTGASAPGAATKGSAHARVASVVFAPPVPGAKAGPELAPGSNPSVLPADVLIADRSNSRLLVVSPTGRTVWTFPRPGDLAPGQTFQIPDDAFFTPDGRYIIATEEDDQVVSIIDVATHRIVWRYGTPGVPGNGPNHLSNPDDAMVLPDGNVVVADIKNCSILFLKPHQDVPIARIGLNSPYCYHQPPYRFGSPNGAFPLRDHHLLVTEINGDWVDEMTPAGQVLWSTHPPGVTYPSDTNEVSPNRYLTADYSNPGQAVEFNSQGQLLWRYGPASGPGSLNQPSLCVPVPRSGDVMCNDDLNDRVVVIDPRTDKIVWQYGHKGVPGTAPGYLHQPDGIDLAPPYSLDIRFAPSMVSPPTSCAAGNPTGTCTFGAAAATAG